MMSPRTRNVPRRKSSRALVLNIDKAAQHRFARGLLALFEHHEHAVIGFGRADAINAGDAKPR